MENESKTSAISGGAGISFTGLLTIVFIVLKLCHVIDWAWIWVLAPLWGSLALATIIITIVLAVVVLKDKADQRKKKKK